MNSKYILLVEDDPDDVKLIREPVGFQQFAEVARPLGMDWMLLNEVEPNSAVRHG